MAYTVLFLSNLDPVLAQYWGNVDPESGKTGKNTLEEALKLQRERVESVDKQAIVCGAGTIEKDGFCVPDTDKQIQDINNKFIQDLSKILSFDFSGSVGPDFEKFVGTQKSQEYTKVIKTIATDPNKKKSNLQYDPNSKDPFWFVNREALTEDEYATFVKFENDFLAYLKQIVKTKLNQIDLLEKQTVSKINSLNISQEQKIQQIEQIRQRTQQVKSEFVTALSEGIHILEESVSKDNKIQKTRNELLGGSDPLSKTPSGGGCLVATATYGTELSSPVQFLREIRDNVLFSTYLGTEFMTGFNEFYYAFSPIIADLERQHPAFRETVKVTITPMLSTLSILNYVNIDSEQEILGYGIGIILLNVGIYFIVPAIVVFKLEKTFRHRLEQ